MDIIMLAIFCILIIFYFTNNYEHLTIALPKIQSTISKIDQKITPSPTEQKITPSPTEQKIIPPPTEQKIIPPSTEQKITPPLTEQKIAPSTGQKIAPPTEQKTGIRIEKQLKERTMNIPMKIDSNTKTLQIPIAEPVKKIQPKERVYIPIAVKSEVYETDEYVCIRKTIKKLKLEEKIMADEQYVKDPLNYYKIYEQPEVYMDDPTMSGYNISQFNTLNNIPRYSSRLLQEKKE
jgi:hypothetical protein